ncbi:MAG: beta-galactosidase small subunit [Lachnospiraceae bacterium]|nr:beta-galactosidase small subunit [Lachnospiraceae bacterium]
MDCTNRLRIVFGDYSFGVHGKEFDYIFSYGTGGLESLAVRGKEWLYRSPRPTFWRALTDNDKGCRFQLRSGMWHSADMFQACVGIRLLVDGQEYENPWAPNNNQWADKESAERIEIAYTYETITVPKTTVEVTYKVDAQGTIGVKVHYFGKEELPELPVFGMRFIMPTRAASYTYEGLSGETYPDRMAGGIPGVYKVEGMPVTPYMVPQDCGVHMATKWVEITRNYVKNNADNGDEEFSLRFEMDEAPFAFSCLPYTAQELENASHHEELPLPRRCVLSVLGAVRGVGGINSWGADVEEPYRISGEKDICYSFKICF